MTASVALTGGTGFVGGHVAAALRSAGHPVRALVRRAAPELAAQGVALCEGGLESELDSFVAGSDAVIHVAGAVRARDARTFHAANAEASSRLARAAAAKPGRRFIQISSVAAKHPGVSSYAASKAAGEAAVLAQAERLHVLVVRPPAVYGPRDRATLPLLRGLARGLLVHPGARDGRFSLLYAEDLARLVVALLAETTPPPPAGTVLEPDDGKAGGYGWADLAAVAAERTGRRVRLVRVPRAPLSLAARLAEWHGGRGAGRPPPILSRGKVAELYHPDWVSDTRAVTAAAVGWRPRVPFGDGLVATLSWYRAAGWL